MFRPAGFLILLQLTDHVYDRLIHALDLAIGLSMVRLGSQLLHPIQLTEVCYNMNPVLYQVAKHLKVPHETFKAALHKVLDKKATAAYVKAKEQLLIKDGLLYSKTQQGQANEIMFQFVVPQRHQGTNLDSCHQEAAHQGQCCSTTLMQECF